MKLQKITALMLSVALVASAFTSCGKPSEAQSPAQSGTSSSEAKGTSEPKEKTVVNIWSATFFTEEYQALFTQAFEKTEHAESIQVKFEETPSGTNQEKADALLTNLIGDGDIDIFDANLSEYFNFAGKGMFENLEPYAASDGFDFNTLGKDNVDLSRINGNLYAMPYVQSVWLMYYNKDLFDAANEPYPTDDMTWDDFRAVAKRLTKGEGVNKQWGFTMPDWPCTWSGMATQTGISFVNDDGTINLDNPAFRDALQLKYDMTMVDKSGPSLAENTVTKAHYTKQFSAGNIAMMVAGDWVHGSIKTNLDGNFTFKYDVVAMPHPEGVKAGTTYGAPRYTGINAKRNEQQKKAAWEVMKFMAGDAVAKIMVENASTLPANVSQEIIDSYGKSLPDFVKNGAIIFQEHTHVEEKPYHIASAQIDKVMKEESQLYLTDAQSLDDTMKKIAERSNEEAVRAKEAIGG